MNSDEPSAILLNLTMSHDNKTLLLNHQAILPPTDSNTPPRINAYQVPRCMQDSGILELASAGVLNGSWDGFPVQWRSLALDYDRFADPEDATVWAHQPSIKFRIMGIGVPELPDFELDPERQLVLEVELKDTSYTTSQDPRRNYEIIRIESKLPEESYEWIPRVEERVRKCTLWSWRCPDIGLRPDGVAPWYRFIWRSRFDEYGRIGSLRHAVYKKASVLAGNLEEAGPWMVVSFGILMTCFVVLRVVVVSVQGYKEGKARKIRDLAVDDRLLGEDGGEAFERYVDDVKEEVMPIPPTKKLKELVNVRSGEA